MASTAPASASHGHATVSILAPSHPRAQGGASSSSEEPLAARAASLHSSREQHLALVGMLNLLAGAPQVVSSPLQSKPAAAPTTTTSSAPTPAPKAVPTTAASDEELRSLEAKYPTIVPLSLVSSLAPSSSTPAAAASIHYLPPLLSRLIDSRRARSFSTSSSSLEWSTSALSAVAETVEAIAKSIGMEAFLERHAAADAPVGGDGDTTMQGVEPPAIAADAKRPGESQTASEKKADTFALTMAAQILVLDVELTLVCPNEEGEAWKPIVKVRATFASDASGAGVAATSSGPGQQLQPASSSHSSDVGPDGDIALQDRIAHSVLGIANLVLATSPSLSASSSSSSPSPSQGKHAVLRQALLRLQNMLGALHRVDDVAAALANEGDAAGTKAVEGAPAMAAVTNGLASEQNQGQGQSQEQGERKTRDIFQLLRHAHRDCVAVARLEAMACGDDAGQAQGSTKPPVTDLLSLEAQTTTALVRQGHGLPLASHAWPFVSLVFDARRIASSGEEEGQEDEDEEDLTAASIAQELDALPRSSTLRDSPLSGAREQGKGDAKAHVELQCLHLSAVSSSSHPARLRTIDDAASFAIDSGRHQPVWNLIAPSLQLSSVDAELQQRIETPLEAQLGLSASGSGGEAKGGRIAFDILVSPPVVLDEATKARVQNILGSEGALIEDAHGSGNGGDGVGGVKGTAALGGTYAQALLDATSTRVPPAREQQPLLRKRAFSAADEPQSRSLKFQLSPSLESNTSLSSPATVLRRFLAPDLQRVYALVEILRTQSAANRVIGEALRRTLEAEEGGRGLNGRGGEEEDAEELDLAALLEDDSPEGVRDAKAKEQGHDDDFDLVKVHVGRGARVDFVIPILASSLLGDGDPDRSTATDAAKASSPSRRDGQEALHFVEASFVFGSVGDGVEGVSVQAIYRPAVAASGSSTIRRLAREDSRRIAGTLRRRGLLAAVVALRDALLPPERRRRNRRRSDEVTERRGEEGGRMVSTIHYEERMQLDQTAAGAVEGAASPALAAASTDDARSKPSLTPSLGTAASTNHEAAPDSRPPLALASVAEEIAEDEEEGRNDNEEPPLSSPTAARRSTRSATSRAGSQGLGALVSPDLQSPATFQTTTGSGTATRHSLRRRSSAQNQSHEADAAAATASGSTGAPSSAASETTPPTTAVPMGGYGGRRSSRSATAAAARASLSPVRTSARTGGRRSRTGTESPTRTMSAPGTATSNGSGSGTGSAGRKRGASEALDESVGETRPEVKADVDGDQGTDAAKDRESTGMSTRSRRG